MMYNNYWLAVVVERLRRLARNQIPSGSVGSNPIDCEELRDFLFICWKRRKKLYKYIHIPENKSFKQAI